jgi:hypothetical protein
MSRNLVQELVPADWDSGKPQANSGFSRVRLLQNITDLFNRPVNNRQAQSTNATAIATTGAAQSSGIGTAQQQPTRYAEFTVKARVTFNVNSVGPVYVYVYRTLGTVPVNGAAPNVGDVVVGGDAFAGGAMTAGVNQSASFSFLDSGLSVSAKYTYYLAVKGPNGNTVNLVNSSQLLVMERS